MHSTKLGFPKFFTMNRFSPYDLFSVIAVRPSVSNSSACMTGLVGRDPKELRAIVGLYGSKYDKGYLNHSIIVCNCPPFRECPELTLASSSKFDALRPVSAFDSAELWQQTQLLENNLIPCKFP